MAEQEAGMIGRDTKMAEQVSEGTAREIKMAVQQEIAQGIAVIGVEVMVGVHVLLSQSIN